MKHLVRTAMAALVLVSSTGLVAAQPYQDQRRDEHRDEHRYEEQRRDERRYDERRYQSVEEHNGWRRGQEMRRDDWDRGDRFDYRERGLREPPYGYEWREVNGAYVLGAIATGVILDLLLTQPR